MNQEKMYCGIDVSAETLDICYQAQNGDKQNLKVKNNKQGFAQILKHCPGNFHFVMEATGVYHLQLVFFLNENAQAFSVVNALQIKRYIQMHLERNKSDKKDAKRICEYGIERHPAAYEMPDSAYFECRSLNNAIEDLTKEITKISNQIHSLKKVPYDASIVIKSYQSIIKKNAVGEVKNRKGIVGKITKLATRIIEASTKRERHRQAGIF